MTAAASIFGAVSYPAANTVPAPGVYENVPMDVYHSWQAASNSRLARLRRSPAHLKAYLEEPKEDTPSQIIGRAIHAAILEPDVFTLRYGRCPDDLDRRTKAGKETWERMLNEFGEGNVLKAGDYDKALRIRDVVHVHSSAGKVLKHAEHRELSIVWIDEATGVTCKARFDSLTPGVAGGVIADIKSTIDASERAFARTIFEYGYHRQGAFYLDGAAVHQLPVAHYLNIAVEKEPPFAAACYRIMDAAIDAGRDVVRGLLKTYATCQALNEWPAYPHHVIDIALPDWAWKQADDEIQSFGTDYESVL